MGLALNGLLIGSSLLYWMEYLAFLILNVGLWEKDIKLLGCIEPLWVARCNITSLEVRFWNLSVATRSFLKIISFSKKKMILTASYRKKFHSVRFLRAGLFWPHEFSLHRALV